MQPLCLAALILLALSGVFTLQYHLQMFQQSSYYPSRYYSWFSSHCSTALIFSVILIAVFNVLAATGLYLLCLIATALVLLIAVFLHINRRKKAIKRLVYTPRIKRLIVTFCTVYLLLVILYPLAPNLQIAFFIPVSIFALQPHLLMMLSNCINKPIEGTINRRYVNDAKRILKAHKGLITLGVTGSYGKTSVKFILNRILSEAYNTTATPESFNTPMGIVRTVRQYMRPQTEVFIAEMGAKNKGDIKELCDLCHPTLGVITAVGPQHLETFGTVEAVADTKFELADEVFTDPKGRLYVNFDSEQAKLRALKCENQENIISFGTDSSCSCYAEDIRYSPQGISFTAVYGEKRLQLSSKLLGKHNVTNILGSVAVAVDMGVDEKQIRFAVASLKPTEHRLQIKPFIKGSVLIDDAYNSNPEGSTSAVRVLGSFEGMRRIIVTPGMVELGDKEYEFNFAFGNELTKWCDYIILVGKNRSKPMTDAIDKTSFDKDRLYIADTFKDAMGILAEITDENTVVLFENDLPDNYAG